MTPSDGVVYCRFSPLVALVVEEGDGHGCEGVELSYLEVLPRRASRSLGSDISVLSKLIEESGLGEVGLVLLKGRISDLGLTMFIIL